MIPPDYTLDHVAHAVPDLKAALNDYSTNFNLHLLCHEMRQDHGVELAFLDMPGGRVELLAPLGESSALAKFLDKNGPGLHHLCYRVNNIEAELKRLKELGHKLIDNTPRAGAMDTLIAFVHPSTMGGVLVELCEYQS